MANLQHYRIATLLVISAPLFYFLLGLVRQIPDKTVTQWVSAPFSDGLDLSAKEMSGLTDDWEQASESSQEQFERKEEKWIKEGQRKAATTNDAQTKTATNATNILTEEEKEKLEKPSINYKEQEHKVPDVLRDLVESMTELKGRHSDFIMPECQQTNTSTYSWKTREENGFLGPFDYLPNYKNPCWLDERKRLRCVPYFYLIGAPKAGSTDLFWRLTNHPDVMHGWRKEVRWFDRLRFEDPGMRRFEDYVNFFNNTFDKVFRFKISGSNFHQNVIGDGSPTYYFSSNHWKEIPGNEGCSEPRVTAMSHIHHLWPKAKLILLLRNPVTRLYSTYLYNSQFTNAERTPEEFHEWVLQSLDVWYQCRGNHSFRYCMYETEVIRSTSKISTFAAGIYSRYVLDLLKIFPREQLLVVHLEDYSSDVKKWLRRIFQFLSLRKVKEASLQAMATMEQLNTGKHYAKAGNMWPSTRRLLEDFYRPYNRELAAILDDQKFLWDKG